MMVRTSLTTAALSCGGGGSAQAAAEGGSAPALARGCRWRQPPMRRPVCRVPGAAGEFCRPSDSPAAARGWRYGAQNNAQLPAWAPHHGGADDAATGGHDGAHGRLGGLQGRGGGRTHAVDPASLPGRPIGNLGPTSAVSRPPTPFARRSPCPGQCGRRRPAFSTGGAGGRGKRECAVGSKGGAGCCRGRKAQ